MFGLSRVAPAAVGAAAPVGAASSPSETEQHRAPGALKAAAVTDMLVVLDEDDVSVAVPSKATDCCEDVSDVAAVSDAVRFC